VDLLGHVGEEGRNPKTPHRGGPRQDAGWNAQAVLLAWLPAPMTSLSPDRSIPSQAIAELQQGRKIEAIRLVRAAQGLGLKEAKDAVEAYIQAQPALRVALEARNKEAKATLVRCLAVVAAMIAAAYVLAAFK
jgi:hypothetical protein